jgi:NhaP-type Na+/H+ or K+/H+ antiporter
MPNLIPDWLPWMRPADRLILSVVFFLIGLAIFFALLRRPKPDRPTTWAECIAGAVGVFGMMTLIYAVIPHEWITFSDKYLQWDTTVFVFRNNQKMLFFPWNWPFSFDKHNIRDIIVVVIYGIGMGLNVGLFVAWQKRGQEKPEAEAAKPRTSRFGRPLRRRAQEPVTVGATLNGGDA